MADEDGPTVLSIGGGDMKAVRFRGQSRKDFRTVERELGCSVSGTTSGYVVTEPRASPYDVDRRYDDRQTVKRGDWLVKGRFGDVHTFKPKEFEGVFGDQAKPVGDDNSTIAPSTEEWE